MDNCKEIAFSRHKRADAHVTSETGMACTGPAQAKPDKIPTQRRESGHNVPSGTKNLLTSDFWEGEVSFSQYNEEESVNVYLTT